MKKRTLLASIVGMTIIPVTNATTVGFAVSPTARTVTTSLGTALSSTSLVLLGNFVSETFSFNSAVSILANYQAIKTAGGWAQFTLDRVTETPNTGTTGGFSITASPAGKLGGTATDNNTGPTKADYFSAKNAYVWIFDASTIAASTQMGIFRATAATTPWVFPTNAGGIGDSVQLSTLASQTTIAAIGVGVASGTAGPLMLVAAVPEPSTAFLSAMGLIAMASRRRRNRD